LAEHENLKLARDVSKGRSRPAEMTGSGVINQNVEVTSFRERGGERFFD
jgi:hypothetical protein